MSIPPATPDFRISSASEQDIPLILQLIRELADYERLSAEVVATESQLKDVLFGAAPAAEVLLGYVDGEPAGFAVFFRNFSTFLGQPGLHLEDLFVRPRWRGQGFGRRLLAAVAEAAVTRGCGRLEWAVLDWNEPAIGFYRRLGARSMDDWTTFRVTGDALRALATTR